MKVSHSTDSLLPTHLHRSADEGVLASNSERDPRLNPSIINTDVLETPARSWRALKAPFLTGVTNTALAVGSFTSVTGWLGGPSVYKTAGPVVLAGGLISAAYQWHNESSASAKVRSCCSMLGIAAGSGLYQWSLMKGPPVFGATGFALLLSGCLDRLVHMGQGLARAEVTESALPVTNDQLKRALPMFAAGVVLATAGAWIGRAGFDSHSEVMRVGGEVAMTAPAAALVCLVGLVLGRLPPDAPHT